jgi:hypothetical protein
MPRAQRTKCPIRILGNTDKSSIHSPAGVATLPQNTGKDAIGNVLLQAFEYHVMGGGDFIGNRKKKCFRRFVRFFMCSRHMH